MTTKQCYRCKNILDTSFFTKDLSKKDGFRSSCKNCKEKKQYFCEKDGKKDVITDYDITRVYLSEIDEREINEWIESGEAMDKAGAYAIQGQFSKFIVKFEGSYNSVVGLPVQKLYQIIKKYVKE